MFVCVCLWQALALVRDSPVLTKVANSALYPLIYVVQQFIHWLFMGYPLVPFCLFAYDKWLKVTRNSQRPHGSEDERVCSHLQALGVIYSPSLRHQGRGPKHRTPRHLNCVVWVKTALRSDNTEELGSFSSNLQFSSFDLQNVIILTRLTNPNTMLTTHIRA